MLTLTAKQTELLRYIELRIDETGVAPSFDEMRGALGLKSKSGIVRLIDGLEERGAIRRLPQRNRAIEIVPPGEARHEIVTSPHVRGEGEILARSGRYAWVRWPNSDQPVTMTGSELVVVRREPSTAAVLQ